NQLGRAALAGAAGAVTLTAIHEIARRLTRRAPRMDLVAVRGLEMVLEPSPGCELSPRKLHRAAFVLDLVSNSAYYALVGLRRPRRPLARGAVLGLAAGGAALVLPRRVLGRDRVPGSEDPASAVMTVAWYLAGGLAAGAAWQALARRAARRHVHVVHRP